MKKIIICLAICLAVSTACLAESSADRFLSSLSDTWDAFVDMAGDAGKSAVEWADDTGVMDWLKNTGSGLVDWAQESAHEFAILVEENQPAIEAWLDNASEEIKSAWDTLVNPDGHTSQDIQDAYDTVMQALEDTMIWTANELPVSVRYDRMWAYSANGKTDDPAVIAALVDAIKALKVGEETDKVVDDFTDLITFTFSDGTTRRLEFEEGMWVTDHGRYRVQGMGAVRNILDGLISE